MLVEYRKNTRLLSVRAQVKHRVMLTTAVYVYLLHAGTPYLVLVQPYGHKGAVLETLRSYRPILLVAAQPREGKLAETSPRP